MFERTPNGLRVAIAALLIVGMPYLASSQTSPISDVAIITVRVPGDAKVTIGDGETAASGTERTFVTPTLKTGNKYSYKIVGTWSKDGKAKRVERTVRFKAGDSVVVDLTQPEPDKSKDKLKDKAKDKTKETEKPKEKPKDKSRDKPKDKSKEDLKGAEKLKMPKVEKEKRGAEAPKSRKFQFTYGGTVTGAKAGDVVRVWVPVPQTTGDQKAKLIARKLPQGSTGETQGVEPLYGNRMLSFEAKADGKGEVPFSFVYEVTRKEVKGEAGKGTMGEAEKSARFLQADVLVPITGKPLDLLEGKTLPSDPMGKARVMYDVVNDHMKYSKEGTGWGRGDSVWACDSKFGNCSDFHSLFISMARANKVPAKFEIGFPLPEKRGAGTIGGYHCWAFFHPEGKGWVPVDISEANKNPMMKNYYFGNLTEDRITFTTGRDVNLVPKQSGKALNFFIYPYAEIKGKEVPQEKIVKKFAFEDLK